MSDAELTVGAAQVSGVYAPLAYMSPADPTQGGYQWLSPTDYAGGVPHTLHPAVDLNSTIPGRAPGGDADLGAPIVAAVDAVVAAVLLWDGHTTGYGNVCVLETADARATPHVWLKHCHLERVLVVPGQRVVAGEPIATCGHSGTTWAHLHWEILYRPTANWSVWPYGWSREEVERYWMRPADWFWQTVATATASAGGGGDAVSILNGAQQAAVQAAVWGDYWNADAADFAIPASWREEWKAGRWPGAPLGPEQLVPASEDKPAGSFQLFQRGCACWLPDQPVSWEG